MIFPNKIEEYLEIIREGVPNAVEIFTKGNCITIPLLLKITFPGGIVLHNIDHACYQYNGICFDINGNIKKPKNSKPISEYDIVKIRSLLKNNYETKNSI